MEHLKFRYKDINEFKTDISNEKLSIPVSDDVEALKKPVAIGRGRAWNSMAIQPMEGCDSRTDGKPSDLTLRRYERFAAGNAGLIWVEACAVIHEGKANPKQLHITEDNLDSFKNLVHVIERSAGKEKPYLVLQLTHSGRYSRPVEKPAPIIAVQNPYLDKPGLDYTIITDEQLEKLEDFYVEAANLAKEAGFDAVDIKSCHRYLINELLSAHTREGIYGGSFENRSRFLLNIVKKIKGQVDIDLAVRLNAFDEIPYPYGFGTDKQDFRRYDLSETKELVKLLVENGVSLIDVTGGNPYYNPHVNRPYDIGPYIPPTHQLKNVEKIINAAKELKQEVNNVVYIGSGMSWLREYGANVGAGAIKEGYFDIMGLGRQGFAYPDYPKDIISGNGMIRSKCCIACSKCTDLMRAHSVAGCVIKDAEVYAPIYKEAIKSPQSKNIYIQEHI